MQFVEIKHLTKLCFKQRYLSIIMSIIIVLRKAKYLKAPADDKMVI
jgi:hypothetical protein